MTQIQIATDALNSIILYCENLTTIPAEFQQRAAAIVQICQDALSEINAEKNRFPHQGRLIEPFDDLNFRSRPAIEKNNIIGKISPTDIFTVYAERNLGGEVWWFIVLPDGTAGWGAKHLNGVNYLEKSN